MISVIIPVFNEVKTIKELVERVQSVDLDKEIIIVDDAAADRTVYGHRLLSASTSNFWTAGHWRCVDDSGLGQLYGGSHLGPGSVVCAELDGVSVFDSVYFCYRY